ncbi:MAG: BLUF domain-containing protein [Pseudomonadota bacterium]
MSGYVVNAVDRTGDAEPSGPEHGGAIYCLSYVSTQTQRLGNDDLLHLLHGAREKNARLGITGILLHRDDSFFQILEGGEEEVLQLFKCISKDGRHQRVEIVTEGPVGAREYTDWQMAFIELDGQDYSAMPGFSDMLKDTPEAREFLRSLSRSKKLALLFSVLQ